MGKYLIPKPINRQFELLAGWGLTQVAVAGVGIVTGLGMFVGVVAVGLPVPLGLVALTLSGGVGVMLALPQPGGHPPLYRRLQDWWAYKHSQTLYLYDWGGSDWDWDDRDPDD